MSLTIYLAKNNLPYHLVNLRKNICESLNIEISELPFAGELMQLKPEMEWQPGLRSCYILLHCD